MKTILVDAGGTLILKGKGIYEEMLALLEQYPNPKIIVSNANDEEIIKNGLTNLPYPLFTLKHNPDKSDPKYFIKLLDEYCLVVQDVVYFDHVFEAVASAQSLGITAQYYDQELKDLDVLKTFLDDNCKE